MGPDVIFMLGLGAGAAAADNAFVRFFRCVGRDVVFELFFCGVGGGAMRAGEGAVQAVGAHVPDEFAFLGEGEGAGAGCVAAEEGGAG